MIFFQCCKYFTPLSATWIDQKKKKCNLYSCSSVGKVISQCPLDSFKTLSFLFLFYSLDVTCLGVDGICSVLYLSCLCCLSWAVSWLPLFWENSELLLFYTFLLLLFLFSSVLLVFQLHVCHTFYDCTTILGYSVGVSVFCFPLCISVGKFLFKNLQAHWFFSQLCPIYCWAHGKHSFVHLPNRDKEEIVRNSPCTIPCNYLC